MVQMGRSSGRCWSVAEEGWVGGCVATGGGLVVLDIDADKGGFASLKACDGLTLLPGTVNYDAPDGPCVAVHSASDFPTPEGRFN